MQGKGFDNSLPTSEFKGLLERLCAYCGNPFTTPNVKRMFCRDRCRREADNARKRERRAEERAERELPYDEPFFDPWERNDAELVGSLSDGWTDTDVPCLPCGIQYCADEAIGGPLACQQCSILQELAGPCDDCPLHRLELETASRRNFGPSRLRRFSPSLVCVVCEGG